MSRRIVVSSNCQTAGIAAALQDIFPRDKIIALPLSDFGADAASQELADAVADAQVWVSAGNYTVFEKYGLRAAGGETQVVKIPVITFSAFHPDCTYLRFNDTGEVLSPNYNSGIAAWGYLNNVDAMDCARLFNKQVFGDLGYLNAWEANVRYLQQRFSITDIDFNLFMLPIKRAGIFMHTINHPKSFVLTRIAQIASRKMGAADTVLENEIDVPDSLAPAGSWPVYPEIGDSLAVPSSYRWRPGSGVASLDEYLAAVYRIYDSLDLRKRKATFVNGLGAAYDRVLGARVRTQS